MDFFDYCYNNRKGLSQFALVILLIVEIFFLFRPIMSSPVKGSYSGDGESLRLHDQTYDKGAQKGFYYFDDRTPEWFREEYGMAGIVFDNGDVYGIKSAFVICNTDTGAKLISSRAVFIQIIILAVAFVLAYMAFIEREEAAPPKNKSSINEDDDYDVSRLKGWKEP